MHFGILTHNSILQEKPYYVHKFILKNNLKKTFKVLLLKILYALEIQEAYNRKSFQAHRVRLGDTGSFMLSKGLRFKFRLIAFFVGVAFYNALQRKNGMKNKRDGKTGKKI